MGRECGDTEAERDRQAHLEAERARGSSKRLATAAYSHEETARRREQRSKAQIAPRGIVTATKQEAKTMLSGPEVAEVMKSKPQRLPDLVLEGPHEAPPEFHEDWTIVEGSSYDNRKWEQELKRRDKRNLLIHAKLAAGRPAWYMSSGNSMWPLVHSGDACTLHPIQAATAIRVGNIVFCLVQTNNLYYTHIVRDIETREWLDEPKYCIGNIRGRINGWCFREHIFGVVVNAQTPGGNGEYYPRPEPQPRFALASWFLKEGRKKEAEQLCLPVSPSR